MVDIDWDIVFTVLISAIVPIIIATVPLLYNEGKKRQFLKMERLWKLKCEKFERLMCLFSLSNVFTSLLVRIGMIRWDQVKKEYVQWNVMNKEDAIKKLIYCMRILITFCPEHAKAWDIPGEVNLYLPERTGEMTRETFEKLYGNVLDSVKALLNSYEDEEALIKHVLELHLINPRLTKTWTDIRDLLIRIPERRKQGISDEVIYKEYQDMMNEFKDMMKEELEDTLNGRTRPRRPQDSRTTQLFRLLRGAIWHQD